MSLQLWCNASVNNNGLLDIIWRVAVLSPPSSSSSSLSLSKGILDDQYEWLLLSQ
jgi:hypothetical protein